MFTTSPAVRIASTRQNGICFADGPNVIFQPYASTTYMIVEGISRMRSATGPSSDAASKMRSGPICQTRNPRVRRPTTRRKPLSTGRGGRPDDPQHQDREHHGSDCGHPEEPVELAQHRKDQHDNGEVSAR